MNEKPGYYFCLKYINFSQLHSSVNYIILTTERFPVQALDRNIESFFLSAAGQTLIFVATNRFQYDFEFIYIVVHGRNITKLKNPV